MPDLTLLLNKLVGDVVTAIDANTKALNEIKTALAPPDGVLFNPKLDPILNSPPTGPFPTPPKTELDKARTRPYDINLVVVPERHNYGCPIAVGGERCICPEYRCPLIGNFGDSNFQCVLKITHKSKCKFDVAVRTT